MRALENVQLELWPGKVTALIGENGAGKSTLVKVMTGIYQPEEGEILYKAIPIHLPTPESAHRVGITAIHQETVLFDELSVTENIFVGQYLHKGLFKKLDWPQMHRRAQEILTRLEVQIDPRATLKTLSIAQRHMVAIARALSFEAQVVILDEPTAALSQHEILEFYQIVEHRLHEPTLPLGRPSDPRLLRRQEICSHQRPALRPLRPHAGPSGHRPLLGKTADRKREGRHPCHREGSKEAMPQRTFSDGKGEIPVEKIVIHHLGLGI